MASPVLLCLEPGLNDPSAKSKKSLSIYQSKRVIDDLQNSLDQAAYEANSSILHINRQIVEGMIVDLKQFDESSKIRKQLLCRDGDENENVMLSFIVLEEQQGQPKKVIYKWKRKPYYQLGVNHAVQITQEEHIYQGAMENNRKHGEGEYILIQRLSDGTEKNTRYTGTWNHDILASGMIEDANGFRKEIKASAISFKTKSSLKGQSTKNLTIKHVSAMMEQKKDKSSKVIISGAIPSSSSIEKVRSKKSNRVVII